MNGASQTLPVPTTSDWRRRNAAERHVRDAIAQRRDLSVFGSGFEVADDGRASEVFVTLTASDEHAKAAARQVLNGASGLDESGWERGWRRLQLGDWIIRVYPERAMR